MLGFLFIPTSVFAEDVELVRCPDFTAVYRIEDDGKRHAFANEHIYFSWYPDFSKVEIISCDALADLMLGNHVPYQAGTRLIKMPSVRTVYAVELDGILRPIPSEEYAATVWGDNWARRVDDLSEALFPSYEVGDPLKGDELPNGTILVEEGEYYQFRNGEYETLDNAFLQAQAIPFDNAWELTQDTAFAPTDCPEVAPRTYANGYYAGPLWDTHIHMPVIPETPGLNESPEDYGDRFALGVNFTIDDIACTFRTEETDRIFGFFSVWADGGMTGPMVETARRAAEMHPDIFVPFIMPPQNDERPDGYPTVDAKMLEGMLEASPGAFLGYGEIGLYARAHGGAPELPPDDPRMLAIYDLLIEKGISLVYVHLGVGHGDNLERVADMYPEINFIFHGDQLVVYKNGYQNLSTLDEILDNHPNVYYGIDELYGDDFLLRPEVSQEEFFAHFENYEPLLDEDIATWGAFIRRHSRQVLWGTDRGWSSAWSLDVETGLLLSDYARAFIGRLEPDVQENYAYKNAERLLNSARTQGF